MTKLETNTQTYSLELSIKLAMERTGNLDLKIEPIIKDLLSEFKGLAIDDIMLAIRYGSLGRYGRTYKLCSQEFCFWVYEFIKEKNKSKVLI